MVATLSRPAVLDTDPGIGDALAPVLALSSPELRVELITTVAGNIPVRLAAENTLRILALAPPFLWPKVAEGALHVPADAPYIRLPGFMVRTDSGGLSRLKRPDGTLHYSLPSPRPQRRAAGHLLEVVKRYGKDLTLIALGPLTVPFKGHQRSCKA